MKQTEHFSFTSTLPQKATDVFEWHLQKGSFLRMVPPWYRVHLLSIDSPEKEGSHVDLKFKLGPFWIRWLLEHRDFLYGHGFSDVQLKGPFNYWRHFHRIEPRGAQQCLLEDEVHFIPPLEVLVPKITREMQQIFRYRHETLAADLETYARYPKKSLRILVSGSSGLVGSALVPFLQAGGHTVISLKRGLGPPSENTIYWDPLEGRIHKEAFEDFDAVIHLAGKNIASGLWTKKRRAEIERSRARDTWLLSQILLRLYRPPKVMLAASATGFYGPRQEGELTERSSVGSGFLAHLCQKWERMTEALEERGVRVVHARFGAVLSLRGGFLQKQMVPLKAGLGIQIGDAEDYLPWIAIDDLLYALYHCMMHEALMGPVNFVSPDLVNRQIFYETLFTKQKPRMQWTLSARKIGFLLGDLGRELFCMDQKVIPEKLIASGFQFAYRDLKRALDHLLP